MAPVHAMVSTKGPMPGVTVHWPTVASLQMPKDTLRNVQILGWVGLIGLTLLFGWLARREGSRRS